MRFTHYIYSYCAAANVRIHVGNRCFRTLERSAGTIDMESVRSAKSARNATQQALAETPLSSTSAFLPAASARMLLTPAPAAAAASTSATQAASESARLQAVGEAYASALKDLLLLDARTNAASGSEGAAGAEAALSASASASASGSLTGRTSGSRPASARTSARVPHSRPGSAVAAAPPATNKYYLSNKGSHLQSSVVLNNLNSMSNWFLCSLLDGPYGLEVRTVHRWNCRGDSGSSSCRDAKFCYSEQ